MVEIVLEDEQDMKLLIKQCYSGSYIQDDEEELLDLRRRMRLAFLGNAFEMQECVWECLESLSMRVDADRCHYSFARRAGGAARARGNGRSDGESGCDIVESA